MRWRLRMPRTDPTTVGTRSSATRQDPASLAKAELRTLADAWQEQRQSLESHQGLRVFNERVRREWAIETGLLERIYLLDRGVTELLIDRGLDASLIPHDVAGQDPQHVVAVPGDHEAAIDVLFDFVKGKRAIVKWRTSCRSHVSSFRSTTRRRSIQR